MLPFTHTLLPLLLPFVAALRKETGVDQDKRLSSAKGHADGAPPFIAGTSAEAFDSLPKLMVQELKEAAGTSKVQEDVKETAQRICTDFDVIVFIESHRGEYLEDRHGKVGVDDDRKEYQKWSIITYDDGETVEIQSHRRERLGDQGGKVVMCKSTSPKANCKGDYRWKIERSLDGDWVFLKSGRGEYLEDRGGKVDVHEDRRGYQKWRVTTEDGVPACGKVIKNDIIVQYAGYSACTGKYVYAGKTNGKDSWQRSTGSKIMWDEYWGWGIGCGGYQRYTSKTCSSSDPTSCTYEVRKNYGALPIPSLSIEAQCETETRHRCGPRQGVCSQGRCCSNDGKDDWCRSSVLASHGCHYAWEDNYKGVCDVKDVEKCRNGFFGQNYCSSWCNTQGKWGCGVASHGAYTCDCAGCNGCQALSLLSDGTYTVQQKVNNRYLDAHESSSGDYSVVTRTAQNNSSQQWLIKSLGANFYTVQQKVNNRYMDAHVSSRGDYSVVTRTAQNYPDQQWLIKSLGANFYTVQQEVTNRYMDAHESGDYSVVTRARQGDNSQRWLIKSVE